MGHKDSVCHKIFNSIRDLIILKSEMMFPERFCTSSNQLAVKFLGTGVCSRDN